MTNRPPKDWLYRNSDSSEGDGQPSPDLHPELYPELDPDVFPKQKLQPSNSRKNDVSAVDSSAGLPKSNKSDVRAALAQLRKQLLDLTAHNPLISYKHSNTARYIRLIDEIPDNITQQLYDGKLLTFAPVPEPSKEEIDEWENSGRELHKKRPPVDKWAEESGIKASYDLPLNTKNRNIPRHSDSKLQTLHYSDALEARLGNLYKISRSMVEETGTNLLHLTFGFLEWYEAGNSEKAHFSPLYNLPVGMEKGSINKKTNTYEYALRIREDEVQFNASIATRLEDDFAFAFPKIDPDQLPDDYLTNVEKAIKASFPRWKVHRWGTLAMFNFSRLLMYRDLDPDNWPQETSLDGHPLVTAVIQRSEAGQTYDTEAIWRGSSAAEHSIDEVEGIYDKYPLVDVADSSQHSALIDAMEGKNLVIQGPPGTGKSQTITNLIAAALHSGKSVLFVSEKLAALDVVKYRMEKLGLGEFCLELHSHNTKKMGVVDSLKSRLEAQFKDTRQLGSHVSRHGDLARELNGHAERVNRAWKQSGMTVIEILTRCVRYWNELGQAWDNLRIQGLDGTTWTPAKHADTFVQFEAYVDQLDRISSELPGAHNLNQHPWRGIQAINLDGGHINDIISLITQWEDALIHLIGNVESFPGGEKLLSPHVAIEKVKEISDAIASMPSESNKVDWPTLRLIQERGLKELDTVVKEADKLISAASKLGNYTLHEVAISEDLTVLNQAVSGLLKTGMVSKTPLSHLEELHRTADESLNLADKWCRRLEEFHEYLDGDTPSFLDQKALSIESLKKLETAIGMNGKLSPGDLQFRNENLLPCNLNGAAEALQERIHELRKEKARQERIFDLDKTRNNLDLLSLQTTIKEPSFIKRLLNRNYREARKAIRAAMRDPKADWNHETIHNCVHELEIYLSKEKGFNLDDTWKKTFGGVFHGLETDLDRLNRLLNWHAELESVFSKDSGKLFRRPELTDSGRWLLGTEEVWIEALQRFEKAGLTQDLGHLRTLLSKIILSYGHKELPIQAILSNPEDEWYQVLSYLRAIAPEITNRLTPFQDTPSESLSRGQERLTAYMKIREKWEEQIRSYQHINSYYFSSRLPNSPVPTDALRHAVSDTRRWLNWLESPDVPRVLNDEIIERASGAFVDDLRQSQKIVALMIQNHQATRDAFASFVSLDSKQWSQEQTLFSLQNRIIEARKSDKLLTTYLTFLRLRGTLNDKGFGAFCRQAEQLGIPKNGSKSIFEYLVTVSFADEIFEEDVALRQFDGILLSKKLKEFRKCDQTLLSETQIRTAARTSARRVPAGYRGTRVSEHTDLALILHETEKQKRHLPLRQLLRRAGKAIQALKPCFMMGPRSVAQYLEPGAVDFDLLVIDEASQMRPADAIGAIARCKQLVVVGDSKQLAPSSFFDRAINAEEEEDEQFEATVAESLLDAVSPVFSRRQLRWHYRSRHPSLIAFSNQQFYDNRLMLFPSPHFSGEALGIRFNYVEEGVFESQVNTAEALHVAERARDLILADPSISLGIATMNAKQRDLVERLLEDCAKNNEAFAEAWELNRLRDESLFIKNLENVQGDEREVMIISCTYGRPSPGVRVMQRFGPINSADGGRRLNVLFTRSRTRMEIFSSMRASDVIVSEKSSDGVRALRGILRYAETGIIEGALVSGREPDSDFEIAAARMLTEHGYEVECQIGVAGFFIDIGVKHPSRQGEYILGVECDGAAFHSSKSARDRDRIRQDVLESMGWTIERIWSTDWFADPHRAIQPILEALSKAVYRDAN